MSRTDRSDGPLPDPVVRALRCPLCGDRIEFLGNALRCPRRHSFDLAKQGYVNLLHARVPAGTADTAEMVAARVDFLAAGHYAPLADAIAAHAARVAGPGLVVDAGAGTGHYLARVLEELPGRDGLALDVSAMALRRAARAHPRIGAAVWNLWEPWPVATGSARVLINVFAPRNGTEFRRVLRPGGALVVASPGHGHLGELAARVGLLEVDRDKERRLDAALSEYFRRVLTEDLVIELTLSPEDARRAVLMGPNAHHLHKDGRRERLAALDEPVEVTASFTISVYEPR
ncbi:putative RNA methyltransferase [Amycolatopsis anabasis]|uniref:putative RNA methyltransferase n=1 Tax=Amycolatopsis anabasis TaxID=1840409 RepID=UPI00131EA62A|nr:rRNA (guanine-N1)-methyltransferase [Amycolatopsis anabasis]